MPSPHVKDTAPHYDHNPSLMVPSLHFNSKTFTLLLLTEILLGIMFSGALFSRLFEVTEVKLLQSRINGLRHHYG